MFLLVENYLVDRSSWSSDRLGIFEKKVALTPSLGVSFESSACQMLEISVFFSSLFASLAEACGEGIY